MPTPVIRPYQKKDRAELIALLRLNIPRYFDPTEAKDFEEYLDRHLESYYVVEIAGRLVGGGGINYTPDGREARISWDFIHPDHHGQGIGGQLTRFRIQEVKKRANIRIISVRTSQLAYAFYQKLGFELERTEKDFWAKGFDLYAMKLELR
jgi:ribosomal protein S18 acetylase RimI-like enzyme